MDTQGELHLPDRLISNEMLTVDDNPDQARRRRRNAAVREDLVNSGAKIVRGIVTRGTSLGAPVERSYSALGEDGTKYRYFLHRRWGGKGNVCLWVTLAPIGHKHGERDPFIERCTAWSMRWGHSSLMMVSLYPACGRSVADALRWRDSAIATPAWHHIKAAAQIAGSETNMLKPTRRIAAWGCLEPRMREDLYDWLEAFKSPAPDECLGVTEGQRILDPISPGARGPQRALPWVKPQPFVYPLPIAADDEASGPPE